jgi:Rrf2 family protein
VNPISQASEHAIRALTHLAQRSESGFQPVREVAHEIGVPAPFLAKILQPLVAQGVLESQRGRGGGVRLALDPAEVTLYRIVDPGDHLEAPRKCFLGQAECSDDRACPVHEFWKRTSGALREQLHTTTLADVIRFCGDHPESGYPRRAPAP